MSQDATGTWNRYASNFRFLQTTDPQVDGSTTFSAAYSGANFAADFNGILTAVDHDIRPHAAAPPGFGGDDLMLGSLQNYPDDPPPSHP